MKAGGSAGSPRRRGSLGGARPTSGSAFLSGLIGSEGFVAARKKPRPARGRNLRFEDDDDEADEADEPDPTSHRPVTDQSPTTPAGIVRTEPDGAWTEAARLMNQLRGGEESMETLGRALEEKTPGGTAARAWREVSSPPPPPTRQAEAARSASPAEAPRSATPRGCDWRPLWGRYSAGWAQISFESCPSFFPWTRTSRRNPRGTTATRRDRGAGRPRARTPKRRGAIRVGGIPARRCRRNEGR